MILGNTSGSGASIGFNNDMTLGAIAHELAYSRPNALGLVDSSDRPIFTDGARSRLTWKRFDEDVGRFARRLLALQLGRDAIIAYQMPNTVESFVVFMGILRAGCIAAPLPLAWRQRELSAAISRLGARAIITTGRAGPVNHAEMLRKVSADVFSVRFLLSYGRNLPDGVIPLDDDICPIDEEPEDSLRRAGPPADHVALITWDALAEGIIPVARSHASLISMALAHVLEANIGGGDVVATSLLSASAAGLSSGFVTALLAGAPLVLHQPFSSRVFAGTLISENVTHAVLPGATLRAMAEANRLPTKPLRSLTALWRPGDSNRHIGSVAALSSLVDISVFGEMGLVALKRQNTDSPEALPEGDIHSGGVSGPRLIKTRIGAQGTLEIAGAMVPRASFPVPSSDLTLPLDSDGWLDTGFAASNEAGKIILSGPRSGVAQLGGLMLPRTHITATLKEALGDKDAAKLECAPDVLFGERLSSTEHMPVERLRASLSEAGVTPALAPQGQGAAHK
jgi:hypothetical protein